MKKHLLLAMSLLTIAACKQKKTTETFPQSMIQHDPHSYAQPNDVVVTHLSLKLTADFNAKVLFGSATWDIENKTGKDTLLLDTRDLDIQKITIDNDSTATTFVLSPADGVFGQKLAIAIKKETKKLTIFYRTSPTAAALQWLSAEQTAGKKFPFLFSQSEAILARTWIPCQDSPGIRFTYDAALNVPNGFLALMSAENPQKLNAGARYTFRQSKPIPAYLMAIAVGNIEFKAVGSKTGVYAEPVTLERAHYEFGQMEDMLNAAEKLYGSYAWGRYDVLVLPPSFPFGGMENPCLTFATPTVITGDRSLVSLIAHELAHSWSGNLVTNATWNDFWLNEGFTVYFERRIMESIEGKEYADMLTKIGKDDLHEIMEELGDTSADTQLKLKLEGRNPDDGMTDIAYEKGFFFLRLIENAVGREKFDAFLKKYFSEHAFKTSNTEDFLVYLKTELFKDNEKGYDSLQVDNWVYKSGIPANFPQVNSSRFDVVETACKDFEKDKLPAKEITDKWSSHEWLHFLRNLSQNTSKTQLATLDKAYHFTQSGNDEILCVWLQKSLKAEYTPAYSQVEHFLMRVGRRKFILPIYRTMVKGPQGKEVARRYYVKARPNYHAVATETIDKLLN